MTKRLVISVLLCAGFAGAWGCRSDSSPPASVPRDARAEAPEPAKTSNASSLEIDREMLRDLRITTTKVETRPAGEAVSVLGELRVGERRYAEVGSPITARAVRLLASAGDEVRAGQILVELQSGDLARARAELATAASRVELAGRVLARKRDLAAERITPEREVQEAESQLSIAEAEMRSARASLQALGAGTDDDPTEPSRFTLRTPIAGTVIERSLAVGQMVDPAKPLFEIADLSRLWLVVHAFERDAVRVKIGDTGSNHAARHAGTHLQWHRDARRPACGGGLAHCSCQARTVEPGSNTPARHVCQGSDRVIGGRWTDPRGPRCCPAAGARPMGRLYSSN